MLRKFRGAEWLTLAGVVLLVDSLFFRSWWKWTSLAAAEAQAGDIDGDPHVITFGDASGLWLDHTDLPYARWFLYVALLLAVAMLLSALLRRTVGWSIVLATPLTLVGFAVAMYMVRRLFDPPEGYLPLPGFYVAMFGTLMIWLGGFWAMRDERVPAPFREGPEPELLTVGPARADAPGAS